MQADGVPHDQLGIAAAADGVDFGIIVQRVGVQPFSGKIGGGNLGQGIAVHAVKAVSHLPEQLPALRQGKAFQRRGDEGRRDESADVGHPLAAAQGQPAGQWDGVQRLAGKCQRVADNTVPAGVILVIAGNAGKYLRRYSDRVGDGSAEDHPAARCVDEHEPLHILHRAQRVVLGKHGGIHGERGTPAAEICQQVGAHTGVVGAPAC